MAEQQAHPEHLLWDIVEWKTNNPTQQEVQAWLQESDSQNPVLLLPGRRNNEEPTRVSTVNRSIVVIGANGSGKTRLGTWLEETRVTAKLGEVHRIAAQKSLTMPESVSPTSLVRAEQALWIGYGGELNEHQRTDFSMRRGHRWHDKPITMLLNDFEQLVIALFSEDYELSTQYRQDNLGRTTSIAPIARLDILVGIWNELLPHRRLRYRAGRVEVEPSNAGGGNVYSGIEMSDGERVAFYFIGQCLMAPRNCVIVVDEPETHLHKTIQADLWSRIEVARPDCLFVYLTHDLDFALSKSVDLVVWLKEFDGNRWDWEVVDLNIDGLSNELYLALLGSRRPILFIEGHKGSLDYSVYPYLYPTFTVIPVGSCDQVIEATRSFNRHNGFHNIVAYGLIDRDDRSNELIERLKTQNVFSLRESELENIFLTEDVMRAVANTLARDEVATIAEAKRIIFQQIERTAHDKVALKVVESVRRHLQYAPTINDKDGLITEYRTLCEGLDIHAIYDSTWDEIQEIIRNRDLPSLLAQYADKGLKNLVARAFGFQPEGYITLVRNSIRVKDHAIHNAVRNHIPVLPPAES